MNSRTILAALATASALALTACGIASTPTDIPAASPPAPTPASSTPAPPAPPPSAPAEAPAPVITFECGDLSMYESGTALYSDGTVGHEPACDTYVPPPAPVLQYCDYSGVAVYTDGSYSTTDPACPDYSNQGTDTSSGYPYDPSQDRDGNGVVNGYERCGLACGEEPTSGEIQLQYLCEQGQATGPECDVFE